MRSTIICFLLGACAACGTMDVTPPPMTSEPQPTAKTSGPKIDKELQRFVDEFMLDCEARRTDCAKKLGRISSITVATIPDENPNDNELVVGLCYDRFFTHRIEINKEIINKPDMYLRVLMYHEIGHCAYGLDHEKEPDMIMSPMMPGLLTLLQHWSSMVTDFFATIQEKHGD